MFFRVAIGIIAAITTRNVDAQDATFPSSRLPRGEAASNDPHHKPGASAERLLSAQEATDKPAGERQLKKRKSKGGKGGKDGKGGKGGQAKMPVLGNHPVPEVICGRKPSDHPDDCPMACMKLFGECGSLLGTAPWCTDHPRDCKGVS